jgi:ATP-dependent RNA helicase RhlE
VTQHSPTAPFATLGLDVRILRLLENRGIQSPTPIQHQSIPVAIGGKDIIGIAQTGTGKTWAFGLPMLQRIAGKAGRALVLVPTRELAAQVEESLSSFARLYNIGTAVFVGGASFQRQREMLRRNPYVLIATPGRLNDHLEQGTVSLREVGILVLDEADRMLDMGFKPQIDRILKHVPQNRQTMLFSATMPPEITRLASATMKLPLRIEVAPAGTTVEKIEQELFIVKREDKLRLLERLLGEYAGSVLVFSRTKHGAKKIARSINAMGHAAAEIHANRSLAQRREALEGFKARTYRVLVATDIAARGIDVMGIELVVNFDLPDDPADYVHRIGRTARAGREGRAISFATPDQAAGVKGIERLIRTMIKRKSLPDLPPSRIVPLRQQTDEEIAREYGYGQRSRGRRPHHARGGQHRTFHKRRGR